MVHAKWDDKGAWQKFQIKKVDSCGEKDIMSGDAVFLVAWTGKPLTVGDYPSSGHLSSTDVHDKWNHRGKWQQLFIENEEGTGPIVDGEVIFLKAWTGAQVDCDAPDSSGVVQARWSHKGSWQQLVVEEDDSPATDTVPCIRN